MEYSLCVRVMSTTDYDRWFRRLKDRAARARILAKIRA